MDVGHVIGWSIVDEWRTQYYQAAIKHRQERHR